MRRLVIDRAKWRCGGYQFSEEAGSTLLLNDRGFMCCLGFECKALGVPKSKLRGATTPYRIAANLVKHDGLLDGYGWNSDWTARAIEINDNSRLTPEERETKLADHFRHRNVHLVFEGEYPDFMQAGSSA